MNANELRIGNYVNLKDKGLYKIDWGYDLEKIEDWEGTDYCTPIPLTEDWLLKFGFVHNKSVNEDGELLINNYTLKIDKYSTIVIEDDFSFGIENEIESVIFDNDVLKSVHRLQNLYFALTQKELTIN